LVVSDHRVDDGSSFLAQAVMANLTSFPASWRRWRKIFRVGLQRLAMTVARQRRGAGRPVRPRGGAWCGAGL